MRKINSLLLVILMTLLVFTACGNTETNETKNIDEKELKLTDGKEEDEKKLRIVTTIFPQYDFVREIGKDKVDLSMLLKPGSESHSFEPTPQDIKTIQEADLFIYVGGENDVWVENLLGSMEKKPDTIELIDLVDTVEEEIVEGMEHDHDHDDEDHDHHDEDKDHDHDDYHEDKDHDHEDHDDHEHSHEVDEHVWTSPQNAITIVKALALEMSKEDAKNSDFYEKNSKEYIAKLEALDKSFKELVEKSKRRTIVFGDRFPLRYFADRYGLKYYAAFPGCSADTDANPQTVAFLVDKVKEEEIPVVFTIELSSGKIADSIVDATGAKKLMFHSVHNISDEDMKNGENYLSLMEKNIQVLKEALD